MDAIGRLIVAMDRCYGPSGVASRPAGEDMGWKEWHHFCVVARGVHVIVNFNLGADLRPAARVGARVARVIALVRDVGVGWDGAVETIDAAAGTVRAPPGWLDLAFGDNTLTLDEGGFRIAMTLRKGAIRIRLALRPLAAPLRSLGTRIGAGILHWVVVPSLLATGEVVVEGRVHRIEQAPAYHDHNWGWWGWGDDFAWQWGFALPDEAPEDLGQRWSLVYSRMTDRARTRDVDRKLYLWEGAQLRRLFSERQVAIAPRGRLRPGRIPKFPPMMRLLCPGEGCDVPAELEVRAEDGGDRLGFCFTPEDLGQIVIPDERGLGVTIINEVSGRLTLEGEVRGRALSARGHGVFEFLEFA